MFQIFVLKSNSKLEYIVYGKDIIGSHIEKNHLKYKDIALKYNVSLSTIKRFIYENKLNMNIENSKNFSKDVFIEIAKKCNCNKTEMSKILGINVKTMERWCTKNDIPFTKGLLKSYISSIS